MIVCIEASPVTRVMQSRGTSMCIYIVQIMYIYDSSQCSLNINTHILLLILDTDRVRVKSNFYLYQDTLNHVKECGILRYQPSNPMLAYATSKRNWNSYEGLPACLARSPILTTTWY